MLQAALKIPGNDKDDKQEVNVSLAATYIVLSEQF